MRSLVNVKEVQQLNGHMAALSRFVSANAQGVSIFSMPEEEQPVYVDCRV